MNKHLFFITLVTCTLIANTIPAIATAKDSRGIDIGLPVYAYPDDPFVTDLKDPKKTPIPPAFIILNIANGDADESILDATADALHARRSANGERVKVIGYVYTSHANRSDADLHTSIDRYLTPRNGKIHFDGIFFDEGVQQCGPTAGSMLWRDKYRSLREYVWSKIPNKKDLVIINIGTAVNSCYLEKGHRAADTFVTFEDTADHYMTDAASAGWVYGWVGGNVIIDGQYALGTQYDSSSFLHLVYGASADHMKSIVKTAFNRYAGYVDVTDDYYTNTWLNPWDQKPTYLNQEIRYAITLGN